MNNYEINQSLILGDIKTPGVLPHVDHLAVSPFIFKQEFGLDELPREPGVILIRGPRQYGKSTWLEQQVAATIQEFGPGSALYLNGDEIKDYKELAQELRLLATLFSPKSAVKRLFIDEISAVKDWQKAVKRIIDAGELAQVLLVTTGSKATDLRWGVERLPGRKGQLDRTQYIFTPISYQEFLKQCGDFFKEDALYAYILSGGSPIGINALAATGRLPDYVCEIVTDWILGEFAATGRSRAHLLAVLQSLYRMAGSPVGQAKLARESGLANNTMAQHYIELLGDLMTVVPAYPFDPEKKITLFRKPCKYHFTNLLVALCWHPQKPRSIADLKGLGEGLGPIFEWVVAQELWRRRCIANSENRDHLSFWQSKEHEIDFVEPDQDLYLEVKKGASNPMNFSWFLRNFNKAHLTVINQNAFETERITGISLDQFLKGEAACIHPLRGIE